MTVERFKLDQIAANEYQTRLVEDPGQVARVAESIAAVGLLQIPVGRNVGITVGDGRKVELAFGHTRLAAYRQLAKEDPQAWAEMPVDVRVLTDLEMFELAVRENLDRRDLTPIEEAKAMATYRDQFHKTSAEIGVLFGLSDSAVRNKMRLLELPAPSGKYGRNYAQRGGQATKKAPQGRKPGRPANKVPCPECSMPMKPGIGLASHRARMHGVKGAFRAADDARAAAQARKDFQADAA